MSTGSNAGGLLVQHAALEQIQVDLGNAVKAIEDRMARLDGELGKLRAEFDGNARTTYDQVKAKWDAAIHEMRLLLNDTGVQVGDSNAEFHRVDSLAASRMGGVF